MSYRNQHPKDDFIPLVVKIFGCLHQHVDNFLHQCANMAWSTKGSKGFSLSILHSYYKQWVLVALQKIQITIVLQHATVVAKKASSRLGVLPSFSPTFLHDLLRATNDGFRS